jgi:hypothetical protein
VIHGERDALGFTLLGVARTGLRCQQHGRVYHAPSADALRHCSKLKMAVDRLSCAFNSPHSLPRKYPMTISMYHASIPRIANMLQSLLHILEKAEQHVEAKKWSEAALTQFRLYPDMLPLTKQVQIATDTAKGVVARLAGVESPVYEDNEQTLSELKQRVSKTLAYVNGFNAAQIDGTEDKAIVTKRGDKETHYTGMQFLLGHAMPNLYFHITTTYAILRHNGVEIGKRDYLGTP